jgi:hypothetical protein
MVFSLWLLLQAFEDDRVWESIRPAGNLFHDLVGAVLEHDDLRLKSRESSPSPRLRGEVNEGGRADSTSIHHALIVLFIVLISTSHSWRVAKPVRFTIIRTAGQIIKGLNCGDLRRHILRCASALGKGEKCRPS